MSVDIQDSFGHSKVVLPSQLLFTRRSQTTISRQKFHLFVNLPVFMCCLAVSLGFFASVCQSIGLSIFLPFFLSFFPSFFYLTFFLFSVSLFLSVFFYFSCLSVCICLYVYQSGVFEIRFHCAGYLGKLGKAARHLN